MFEKRKAMSVSSIRRVLAEIIESFEAIPVNRCPKVKVGIVGEIYVKYSALANNGLENFLAEQDCEVMVPGLLAFMLFKVDNRLEDHRLYGGNPLKYRVIKLLYRFLLRFERALDEALVGHDYVRPALYTHLRELASQVIGRGCKMGEGWLLTAEMMELAENGYGNIVCAQPFGCLPNHIVAKGMIRQIREIYPEANIVPVDYDPGATRVNQENRIKLMLSIARERLAQNQADASPSQPASEKKAAAEPAVLH